MSDQEVKNSSNETLLATIEILLKQNRRLEAEIARRDSLEFRGGSIRDALRRLRLYGVVPLFVAKGNVESLREYLAERSPELLEASSEVWPLDTDALSQSTKDEIRLTSNSGNNRWF